MTYDISKIGSATISRRNVLAALATSATAAMAVPQGASAGATAAVKGTTPVADAGIVKAYDQLLTAQAKLVEARNGLEWIAAEWKHLWPLAPEELLLGANANSYGYDHNAERDIVDRYLVRDTADLRKRFTRKQRLDTPRTCFAVMSSAYARERVQAWENNVPKAKNEAALVRLHAERAKAIAKFQRCEELAKDYEEATETLRRRSGVTAAQGRVRATEKALEKAAARVIELPVKTVFGLSLKAKALRIAYPALADLPNMGGLAALARIAQDAAELGSSPTSVAA